MYQMASKRRIRRRSCTNKMRHATKEDAWKAAAVFKKKKRHPVRPYKCAFCTSWHVGQSPKQHKRTRRKDFQ